MQSRWNDISALDAVETYAEKGVSEDLALRVYTTRLLGRDPLLVLHGGGDTSVKTRAKDDVGVEHEVIAVKGSGWDMAEIEPHQPAELTVAGAALTTVNPGLERRRRTAKRRSPSSSPIASPSCVRARSSPRAHPPSSPEPRARRRSATARTAVRSCSTPTSRRGCCTS